MVKNRLPAFWGRCASIFPEEGLQLSLQRKGLRPQKGNGTRLYFLHFMLQLSLQRKGLRHLHIPLCPLLVSGMLQLSLQRKGLRQPLNLLHKDEYLRQLQLSLERKGLRHATTKLGFWDRVGSCCSYPWKERDCDNICPSSALVGGQLCWSYPWKKGIATHPYTPCPLPSPRVAVIPAKKGIATCNTSIKLDNKIGKRLQLSLESKGLRLHRPH